MSLSFGEDMEEGVKTVNSMDNNEPSAQKESGGVTKTAPPISHGTVRDPSTDTSFLPDRERDARMESEKARLREEWMDEQDRMKKEELEVVYSYWDGSGHRRQIVTTKGATIGKFLELVRCELAKDFIEMKNVSSANLMYVIIACSCSRQGLGCSLQLRPNPNPYRNHEQHTVNTKLGSLNTLSFQIPVMRS